jgi:alpha-galactosidase
MSIKIAFIGAGSVGFTRKLVMDILAVPEFRDAVFSFIDIDAERLEMVTNLCRKMIAENDLPATVESTLERKAGLEGADYVFSTVRVGGLEAFAKDIEIPLKYGVDQCVGDTLSVGGIFYGLRNIPVMLDFCADINEVCPDALFMNYSNPMAMNTWAINKYGKVKRALGLCHGVQGGHHLISRAFELPPEEVDFTAAGINHQTWYIDIRHNGEDLTHKLIDAIEKHPEIMAREPVRVDILRRFGYFSTESNGHLSEYVAWYRKRPDEIEQWISRASWIGGETGGYLRVCREHEHEYREMYPKWMSGEADFIPLGQRSGEHGSRIIEALETGRTYRGHFNVMNRAYITNIQDECVVELPCYVDRNGISPVTIGDLPIQLAAVIRTSISVQEMAVEAAVTGNKDLVRQAVMIDPLSSAVLNPDEMDQMVDEMFTELAPWLPQFN